MTNTNDGTLRIPLHGRGGIVRAHSLVDVQDRDLVAQRRWYLRADGYAASTSRPTAYLHRFLFGLEKGDRREVDHINCDRLDNRRSNLRIISKQQNCQNRRQTRGSSRFRGVCWDSTHRLWQASIVIDRKQRTLGYFHDEVEAARIAEAARIQHMPYAQPDPELARVLGAAA